MHQYRPAPGGIEDVIIAVFNFTDSIFDTDRRTFTNIFLLYVIDYHYDQQRDWL